MLRSRCSCCCVWVSERSSAGLPGASSISTADEHDLAFRGILVFLDPPKPSAKAALARLAGLGVTVKILTGDNPVVAAKVCADLGLPPGQVATGADIDKAGDQLGDLLARTTVFARVSPEHKAQIVRAQRATGADVAFLGDGVNDAPAIKAADIGIAMGSGTEVAKNAGRMILSDDNFATIVYAIEQGRKIFDNLTKYIRFVLVLLVVFVLTFLGASLFDIAEGAPFNPAQVLWIHFFVNAAFGFALGFDLETPGLMARVPKPRGESVLTPRLLITVGAAGLAITIGLLSMIQLGTKHFHSVAVGNSIALTTFALCLVVAALECRSETDSILTVATFDSKQMNRALVAEIILAVLTTQLDALRRLLDTTAINVREFGWALVPVIALFVLWELGKLVARHYWATPTADATLVTGESVT